MKKVVSFLMAVLLSVSIANCLPETVSAASKQKVVATTVYGGHYYELIEQNYTWTKAYNDCVKRGGHLVSITSQGEQDAMVQLVKQGTRKNYWLGAKKDSNNKFSTWVTGETFSYENFAQGQPDKSFEKCLCMLTYDNPNTYYTEYVGDWNDLIDSGTYGSEKWFGVKNFGYICEYDSISTSPSTPSLKSVKSKSSGKVAVTINKVSDAKGYEIQYSYKSNFKKSSYKTTKKKKVTLTNLKSHKKYYVRVRSYKTVSGKRVYSAWSGVKKVSVK